MTEPHWKLSQNGNAVLSMGKAACTVFYNERADGYKYVINGTFGREVFGDMESAKDAAQDVIDAMEDE